MSDKPTIADRLKEARAHSGLTQGQAAALLNMHRPTISEIEAGRRKVKVQEVSLFADIYGVSANWLLNGDSGIFDDIDSKVLLAARELSKLKDEDFNKVMKLLKAIREG